MTTSRQVRWFMAACCFGLVVGCGGGTYGVENIPFCVRDGDGSPPHLAKPAFVLVRSTRTKHVIPLTSSVAGPLEVTLPEDAGVFAVVECTAAPKRIDTDLLEELREDAVPTVCDGQRVLLAATLQATATPLSEDLGQKGAFALPPLELSCESGYTSQAADRTLNQMIATFADRVRAFERTHDRLPHADELHAIVERSSLPPDPWGNPFEIGKVEDRIEIRSVGADGTPGTQDDVPILQQRQRDASLRVVFPGLDLQPWSDYRAYLKARGIMP